MTMTETSRTSNGQKFLSDAVVLIVSGTLIPAIIYLIGRAFVSGYLNIFSIDLSEMNFSAFDILSLSYNTLFDIYFLISYIIIIFVFYITWNFVQNNLFPIIAGYMISFLFLILMIVVLVGKASENGLKEALADITELRAIHVPVHADNMQIFPPLDRCLKEGRLKHVISSSHRVVVFCGGIVYKNKGAVLILNSDGDIVSWRRRG